VSPRLWLKTALGLTLKHGAHPSLNFYEGQKVWKLVSIFDSSLLRGVFVSKYRNMSELKRLSQACQMNQNAQILTSNFYTDLQHYVPRILYGRKATEPLLKTTVIVNCLCPHSCVLMTVTRICLWDTTMPAMNARSPGACIPQSYTVEHSAHRDGRLRVFAHLTRDTVPSRASQPTSWQNEFAFMTIVAIITIIIKSRLYFCSIRQRAPLYLTATQANLN